jgi:hypothetical protein
MRCFRQRAAVRRSCVVMNVAAHPHQTREQAAIYTDSFQRAKIDALTLKQKDSPTLSLASMARRGEDAKKNERMPLARQISLLNPNQKKNDGFNEQASSSFMISSKW